MKDIAKSKAGIRLVILIVAAAVLLSLTMISCSSQKDDATGDETAKETVLETDQNEEKEVGEVSEKKESVAADKTKQSDSEGTRETKEKAVSKETQKASGKASQKTEQTVRQPAAEKAQQTQPKETQVKETQPKQQVCYITIEGYCSGKEISLQGGDTAYSILHRSGADVSGSGSYIKGINGKFEFDEGPTSGWVYSVNGTRPTVGCGSYSVKTGDVINWYYVTKF